jgi:FkbM family methyltransferase
MFSRLIRSIRFRLKWGRIGVWFLRSRDFTLDSLKVGGHRLALSFPPAERELLQHELSNIYFEDCYHLTEICPTPATVVDVGGNIGLFSIVARLRFPRARIHCYEPNPALAQILKGHLQPLQVSVFPEAVGDRAGFVRLSLGENSLHSKVDDSAAGELPIVALDTVVERCGGGVDLLKLDCEGCEWGILEKAAGLDAVREITMEFHLWAKPGSSVEDLTALLIRRGFGIVSLEKEPHKTWGLVHAKRPQIRPKATPAKDTRNS